MKKIFSVLFIVFQFSVFAFAGDFHLAVEPLFGIKNGQIDEFVFHNNSLYGQDKLSELNWDVKNTLFLGGKIDAGFKNIFSTMSLKIAIPGESGNMVDKDWQNINQSSAKGSGLENVQTNWSEHKNKNEKWLDFDISAGYSFNVFNSNAIDIKIRPFLGYEYRKFSFSASNGVKQYGTGSPMSEYTKGKKISILDEMKNDYEKKLEDYEKAVNDGESDDVIKTKEQMKDASLKTYKDYDESGRKDITYDRFYSVFWLGFDSIITFQKKFDAIIGFKISPYLYSESIDTHILRSEMFGDKTPGSFKAFNVNLGAAYNFTPKHSISLNFEYFYCGVLRGDEYEKSISGKTYKRNTLVDGGAAEHYFDLSLSYKFKIF